MQGSFTAYCLVLLLCFSFGVLPVVCICGLGFIVAAVDEAENLQNTFFFWWELGIDTTSLSATYEVQISDCPYQNTPSIGSMLLSVLVSVYNQRNTLSLLSPPV